MLNYLKWELKDYFSNGYKWFIIIGIVFALSLITLDSAGENVITTLIVFSYFIILVISMIGSFFAGTKHTVETFSKKTFLLESMIPVSVKKILLSKYLLGFIINFVYIFIMLLGWGLLFIKGAGLEDSFKLFKELMDSITLEFVVNYICSTVFILSVVILGFVCGKIINPNGKHEKLTGFVFAFMLLYFFAYFMSSLIGDVKGDYVYSLACLGISALSYFVTAYLIENKLEIYN